MLYCSGEEARLGDRVSLPSDDSGVVVFSIDTDEFSLEYPRDDWSYLNRGVMVEFRSFGLIHYAEPEEDLKFIGRASD